jgi:cob(I)alamin adenosyltransferase
VSYTDPSGLYVPDEKCRKAITDARKFQEKIEHEFDKMRRQLEQVKSLMYPIADAGAGAIELCGARQAAPRKSPRQLYEGHRKEIEQYRNKLSDALRRIHIHCKDRDLKEFAAEIGKFEEWAAKPVPEFPAMSPFYPLAPVLPTPYAPRVPG